MNALTLIGKVAEFLGLVMTSAAKNKTDYTREIQSVEREIEALKIAAAEYDAEDQAELDAAVPYEPEPEDEPTAN